MPTGGLISPEPRPGGGSEPPGPLAGPSGAWRVEQVATTGSTNADVAAAARSGAAAGLVVVADHQTAGRGRLGRTWSSVPGAALLVSVLVRPDLDAARAPLLTLAAALALSDGVADVCGVSADLKWPNDLVVGSRKLAGLLAERHDEGGPPAGVVLGAGCDVARVELGPELDATATSCAEECGHDVDPAALLTAYLQRLSARLVAIDDVVAAVAERMVTLGRQVRVERVTDPLVGRAVALGPCGELVVRTAAGREHTVRAGDVVHLRDL